LRSALVEVLTWWICAEAAAGIIQSAANKARVDVRFVMRSPFLSVRSAC
jgi:hypothetical protein